MSDRSEMDQHASINVAQVGQPSKPDLNGHQVEDMAEDEPHANGHQKFESILMQLDVLSPEQVEEVMLGAAQTLLCTGWAAYGRSLSFLNIQCCSLALVLSSYDIR